MALCATLLSSIIAQGSATVVFFNLDIQNTFPSYLNFLNFLFFFFFKICFYHSSFIIIESKSHRSKCEKVQRRRNYSLWPFSCSWRNLLLTCVYNYVDKQPKTAAQHVFLVCEVCLPPMFTLCSAPVCLSRCVSSSKLHKEGGKYAESG